METGRIIKNISNQYTIESNAGSIVAKPRGNMRRGSAPVVGDIVEYEKIEDTYRINRILPRKNKLLRPSVSNVDQAIS